MSYAPPRSTGNVPIVTEKDAAIVLPPPSASNPVPTLPSALRLDNREQLMTLLETDPAGGDSPMATKRQLLVFASDSLRTLLMRQVLSDPSTRTYKGKKNWDPQNIFPFPRGLGIVGTRILPASSVTHPSNSPRVRTATETSHDAAEVSLLAESTSLDSVEDGVLPDNINVVTYFIRPTPLAQTQNVAAMIRTWKSNRSHHRIVYLPQPTAVCHKVLTNLGLTVSHNNISIHRLQLDVFPLESDVLSLEFDDAVREIDVEGTPSTLVATAARALLKVQDVVGKIPRIQAVGPVGEEVVRKLLSLTLDEYMDLQEENAHVANEATPDSGDVTALMVMDRKVDMVTPMLTPLTFEGLLDDVIGIDCGFIKVDVNIINPPDNDAKAERKQSEREIVALPAHGSDTLYAEVRDQHVEKFGQFLQNQAKALKESHAEFTNKGKKKDLNEIHQFVKQIPVFTQNLRSLTNHIHLAELVKQNTEETTFRERWQTERSMVEGELCYDMLEDLIASQYPPYRLLQLLCLQSLCGGGIKSSKYDQLKRDVVQTYGYEFLFVLHNLEKAGLLRRRETIWMDSASPFNSLRKSLILINAEVDTVDPDDVSYVSSGYAPLTTRLIQTAIQGWTGKDEVLRELPGRLVDIIQQHPPEELATAMKRNSSPSLGSIVATDDDSTKKPTMIVFFVGGVTFMEIAALRFLSKRQSFPYHIICLTTKVINGKSLLHSLS